MELYNNHWHPFEVAPKIRSESGLQSRYYRILDFPIKVRKKKEPSRPDLGLIPSTNRRYPWMGVITADIEEQKHVESNTQYNTAPPRGIMATRENKGEGVGGGGSSSSEVEGIGRGSDYSEQRSQRAQHWSITEATNVCSSLVLHTSETDSEVEPEREWKKSRSPHGSYELKVPYHTSPSTNGVPKTEKF